VNIQEAEISQNEKGWYYMKSTMKCLVIALAAVIGFSMIALSLTGCGGGGGGDGPGGGGDPTSITYTSYETDGTEYKLEISAAGRAVYTPKRGDTYTLTITLPNGTKETSRGTVESYTTYTITLQHNESNNTVSVTVSGNGISYFSGTIYLDNGRTRDKPENLTRTKPSGGGGTGPGTEADPIALAADVWKDGSVPSASSVVWYSFSVTSGTTYYVWWNDRASNGGDGTKTGDVKVSASYSSGTSIFTNEDRGWRISQSFTANTSGTVKIKVEPYSNSSSYTGTFAIMYSTNPGSGGGGNVALPDAILAEYGLSGFSVPAGATLSRWMMGVTNRDNNLVISGIGSSATDSAINSFFISNGWTLDQNQSFNTDAGTMYQYTKDGFDAGVYSRSGTGYTIMSVKSVSGIVWPHSGIFTECGLSGLPQPAGITDIELVFWKDSDIYLSLRIYSESVDAGAVNSCFLSNGWTLETNNNVEGGIIRSYGKPGFTGSYIGASNGCQITVSKQ
jgi:hypothetical protein